MSRWAERLDRRRRPGEFLLWAGALLTVSAVWAGAATLAARQDAEPPGELAATPAIMIELAPEPEAEKTDTTEITEDRQDAAPQPVEAKPVPVPEPEPLEEVAKADPPPEPVRAPEPEPEIAKVEPPSPQAEPEITETVPPPEADPLESRMLAALENVEVPLPLARPAPPERPRKTEVTPAKERKVRPERKQAGRPPSVAARKASAEVQQSDRNAAPKPGSSKASGADSANWKAKVVAHLERRKRYPAAARRNGEQGTVLVSFRIDGGGRVLSTRLARSSGSALLDDAAIAMVERASPVPAPPPGAALSLTAPVRFVKR